MSGSAPQPPGLAFTGERFVPGTRGEIWVEHWHRYHFARAWASGKRVLDVACGEGYGAALLARDAAHVTGADLSAQAVDHATEVYAALRNLEFVCAPATRLPLRDASIDVAVSFETIEHLREQTEFLAELARVLTPEGVLVLSCPNKLEYTDKRNFVNEFHEKELYRDELAALVGTKFPEMAWYGQRPSFYSVIAPEVSSPAPGRGSVGELIETQESQAGESKDHLSSPLYFIIAASRARDSVQRVPPTLSVLADRDDWVHRDYENVMRDAERLNAKRVALEVLVAERSESIAALQEDVRESHRAREACEATLAMRDSTIAARDATVAARDAEIAEKGHEILRRGGWRWWLRLPLIRLGLKKK